MNQRTILGIVMVVVACGGVWLACESDGPRLFAKDEPKPAAEKSSEQKAGAKKEKSPSKLMRKKLSASQDILEGLTTEDFDMIERGARELKALAGEAGFQISKDAMYIQHAQEFQSLAEKLEKAAKGKSIDKAALHYVNLTMNCIECHRFVRDVLVAGE